MNPRRVVAPIIVAFLVIGVLLAYSSQTFSAHATTTITSFRTVLISGSTQTVTVSGSVRTATVLGQVTVVSATGSQEVLCTATSYVVPDTTTAIYSMSTEIVGNSTTTITYTTPGTETTYQDASVYISATNSTNPAGYVVTSASTDYNAAPSGAWTVMTCTYLP